MEAPPCSILFDSEVPISYIQYPKMESVDLNMVKLRDPSDAEVRENSF